MIGKKTLKYSSWWSDLLDWIYPHSDFLTNVQIELEDYKVPGVSSISNKYAANSMNVKKYLKLY